MSADMRTWTLDDVQYVNSLRMRLVYAFLIACASLALNIAQAVAFWLWRVPS